MKTNYVFQWSNREKDKRYDIHKTSKDQKDQEKQEPEKGE